VPACLPACLCACLPACLQELGKRFSVVCLDESHFIKDGSAQRTKATVPLVREARRALLLTGTPALNKPKEVYQQVGRGGCGCGCGGGLGSSAALLRAGRQY
jgi:hypothetical protein